MPLNLAGGCQVAGWLRATQRKMSSALWAWRVQKTEQNSGNSPSSAVHLRRRRRRDTSTTIPETTPQEKAAMPNWNQLLNEIKAAGSMHDVVRRRYLDRVHEITKRNAIIYYSGWLQKRGVKGAEINDEDKNGFMTVIHELDRNIGVDLILHTPGGDTAATESLVHYLRAMFGTNIRAIVPQLAMSGGTMIACACREIVMGKQSSLGPVDPQFGGIPAHGVVEEFQRAKREIGENPASVPVWQPIIVEVLSDPHR